VPVVVNVCSVVDSAAAAAAAVVVVVVSMAVDVSMSVEYTGKTDASNR